MKPLVCRSVWTLGAFSALLLFAGYATLTAAPFDAAPFGLPLPERNGVKWEDPRELHRVVVHFKGIPPPADQVQLEYWGSWWPGRHLPKDREPGGGANGWLELGNWWQYDWRTADTEARVEGKAITFTFPTGQCQGISESEELSGPIPIYLESARDRKGFFAGPRTN